MKFGKRIQGIADENKQLAAYFVDYKSLKKFLKRIPLKGNNSEGGSGEDEEEEAEDAQERFMLALESEVAKVESFFRSRLAEMLSEFRSLCKKVNKLNLETKITEEFRGFEQLIVLLDGSKEADLLNDFVGFSKEVDVVRSFVMTNAQAAIKITKKHDKVTTGIRLREHYVSVLHRCTFYNSRDFGALIADIEVLATQLMEKLTGRQPSPDDFQCPICMHVLRNPLVLSCGHRFCNSCISVATYFKQHNCPVCRKDIVLDFQNLRVDSLLSRFVQNLHEQKEVGSGGERGACILEKPCNHCAQWRFLHGTFSGTASAFARRRSSGANLVMTTQRELIRRGSSNASDSDANARGKDSPPGCSDGGAKSPLVSKKELKVLAQLTITPQYSLDPQQTPWTACAEIFRLSSKQLIRVGSDVLAPLSPSMMRRTEQESNATWSSKRDLKADDNRCTSSLLVFAVVVALILGFGTGSLTSFLTDSQKKDVFYLNSSLVRTDGINLQVAGAGSEGGLKEGLTAGGGCYGETCQAAKSRVDKLQEARKKSLHQALDNLVARSSKK